MKHLIEAIKNKDFGIAGASITEALATILERKMCEVKKMVAVKNAPTVDDGAPMPTSSAKIAEQDCATPRQAFDGNPKARQEKLYRDVIEAQNTNMNSEKETNALAEDEELDEARIAIVKARVRGGVIQRRKKVSNVPGYTLRGGALKRMSPMERRRRRLGQRKGKIKRRAKLQRSLVKRKRSLRKRTSIGLK